MAEQQYILIDADNRTIGKPGSFDEVCIFWQECGNDALTVVAHTEPKATA